MSRPLQTLLIGHDGSPRSDDALALGRALAVGAARPVHFVVAVVHDADPAVERLLERIRPQCPELDETDVRAVRASSPAAGLHAVARELSADVIIVGASHRHGAERIWPGSVTERVLHDAPCAVAVAPPGYAGQDPGAPQRVGVAFDGSDAAYGGLDAAAAVAERSGATVVLAEVIDVGVAPPLRFDADTRVRALHGDARLELARAAQTLPAELATEQAPIEGQPVDALVELTERLDLLVIGSRGRGAVARRLLGETSVHVLRRAACPVLVVTAAARAR